MFIVSVVRVFFSLFFVFVSLACTGFFLGVFLGV